MRGVAEEVARRREAARTEPFGFAPGRGGGTEVLSGSGNTYLVLPDLTGEPTSCSCPDFARNAGGRIPCKHVEAVKLHRSGLKPSVTPPPRRPPGSAAGIAFTPRGGEVLVFDLETQKAFDEVEGRRPELLRLSLAVVFSYGSGAFDTYLEPDAGKLLDRLLAADLVIGFNQKRFDLEVLRPYSAGREVQAVRCFDLLEDLGERLGHRVSLDGCVRATLGATKSGHGLEAITWFREGRLEELERYCRDDVRLTRDLFDHGRSQGAIEVAARGPGKPARVPVAWAAPGLPPVASPPPPDPRAAVP